MKRDLGEKKKRGEKGMQAVIKKNVAAVNVLVL
jgi:hypothetical protein